MAPKMTRLVSAVDGKVLQIVFQNDKGNRVVVQGDDGWFYVYLHVNNDRPGTDDGAAAFNEAFAPGLTQGQRVAVASTSPTSGTPATPRKPAPTCTSRPPPLPAGTTGRRGRGRRRRRSTRATALLNAEACRPAGRRSSPSSELVDPAVQGLLRAGSRRRRPRLLGRPAARLPAHPPPVHRQAARRARVRAAHQPGGPALQGVLPPHRPTRAGSTTGSPSTSTGYAPLDDGAGLRREPGVRRHLRLPRQRRLRRPRVPATCSAASRTRPAASTGSPSASTSGRHGRGGSWSVSPSRPRTGAHGHEGRRSCSSTSPCSTAPDRPGLGL